MTNFCINCEHYSYAHGLLLCTSPQNPPLVTMNLVTGVKTTSYNTCKFSREDNTMCGRGGRCFSQKAEPDHKPITFWQKLKKFGI